MCRQMRSVLGPKCSALALLLYTFFYHTFTMNLKRDPTWGLALHAQLLLVPRALLRPVLARDRLAILCDVCDVVQLDVDEVVHALEYFVKPRLCTVGVWAPGVGCVCGGCVCACGVCVCVCARARAPVCVCT